MTRIAEHVWADGKCLHCGLLSHQSDKSCIFRDGPKRPRRASIFADLASIGERAREIRTEEAAAIAGAKAEDENLHLADLG